MIEKLDPIDLKRLPRTAVVIQRRRFKLTVRSRTAFGRSYSTLLTCRVSIGRFGFETPAGSYLVLDKEMPPTYTAPDEPWALEAGYRPGEKLPADHPSNPLRGAWLRLTDDGIGIHGTATFPLGEKASHGCIRVRPEDAVALYGYVELGSSVTIV